MAPGAAQVSRGNDRVPYRPEPVEVESAEPRLRVEHDGLVLEIGPSVSSDASSDASALTRGDVVDGALHLAQGERLQASVQGLAPGTPAALWLSSRSEPLGEFVADDQGSIDSPPLPVPADTPACRLTLQATGALPDGQAVQLAVGTWVQANPYPFDDLAPLGVHGAAVGCLADLGIVVGVGEDLFDAMAGATRGQGAAMIARMLGLEPVEPSFPDAATSAHAGAIGALEQAGIVVGYTDGRFRPSEALTRGQAAAMLAAAAGLDPAAEVAGPMLLPDDHRYAGAIGALLAAEVVTGYPDGTFRPDQPVSRAQFGSMLVRLRPVLGLNP